MKIVPVLSLCVVSLCAAMGSSVSVPVREHLKYTFGNHKNHPAQKAEEQRYLRSLAPLKENEIRSRLEQSGYEVGSIDLVDLASELLYRVYVTTQNEERLCLYVDPQSGIVLKKDVI